MAIISIWKGTEWLKSKKWCHSAEFSLTYQVQKKNLSSTALSQNIKINIFDQELSIVLENL